MDRYLGSVRRTKIVATIGPASREPETLVRLVEAGMDVARLNYSHGTLEEHAETVRRVRDAAGRVGRPVAILQDLPGPKLRIGPLAEDLVELTPGEHLTFLCGDGERPGDAHHMSITWPGLPEAVEPDSIMYLADGSVRLRVVGVRREQQEVETEVEVGGAVASRQGLNIPGPVVGLPSVPEEDLHLLRHGEQIGVDDGFFYSAYYCSQAAAQLGGDYWKGIYAPLADTLLGAQNADGSWPPEPQKKIALFGNAYTTAMAVLSLTPPYQLLPVYQR